MNFKICMNSTVTFPYEVLKARGKTLRCLLERLPSNSIMACSSVPAQTSSEHQLKDNDRLKKMLTQFPIKVILIFTTKLHLY